MFAPVSGSWKANFVRDPGLSPNSYNVREIKENVTANARNFFQRLIEEVRELDVGTAFKSCCGMGSWGVDVMFLAPPQLVTVICRALLKVQYTTVFQMMLVTGLVRLDKNIPTRTLTYKDIATSYTLSRDSPAVQDCHCKIICSLQLPEVGQVQPAAPHRSLR
jgi:hypothetical protein